MPFGTTPTPSESPSNTMTAPPSPSDSSSPRPSQTPAAPVAIGGRLYFEDFARPAAWNLQASSSGAVSVLDGRLLLSVHDPAATILQPVPIEPLGDFYAEVELRPVVCSPGDEYGMTIRVKPSGGHYRISLLCEGAARLLRVLPEQTNALTSVTPSDSIIPGGEGTNRLGIAAQGPHLRLFVNRQLVLEDRDSRLPVGGLGLFARPGPGGQTTVAFDNLAVYALAPTPTPTP